MQFPQELVYAFLEHLERDKSSLAACTLVSSSFLPAARTYLFSHITYNGGHRSFEDLDGFLLQNPAICRYIKSLALHAAPPPPKWSTVYDPLSSKRPRATLTTVVLAQLITRLPLLRSLYVHDVHLRSLGVEDAPPLRVHKLALRALLVDDARDTLQLLSRVSCEELHLFSLYYPGCPTAPSAEELATLPTDASFTECLQLRRLRLATTLYECPWLLNTLKFTPAARSIESLDVECSWANQPGPDIRSFSPDISGGLQQLTLRLKNEGFPLFVSPEQITSNLLRMLGFTVCPSLTELNMVGTVDRSFFQFTERFLAHGTFDSLARVNILISLHTASQACLLVMREYSAELECLQDTVLRSPVLRELRFIFQVEAQRQTDMGKEIRDESAYDLIREMLPELAARRIVAFGRSYN